MIRVNTELKNQMSCTDYGFFRILTLSISFFLFARSAWFFCHTFPAIIPLFTVDGLCTDGCILRPPWTDSAHLPSTSLHLSGRPVNGSVQNPSTRPPQNNHPGPVSELELRVSFWVIVHDHRPRRTVFGRGLLYFEHFLKLYDK